MIELSKASLRLRNSLWEIGWLGLMLGIGAVWVRHQTTMSRDAELVCFVGFAACLGAALGAAVGRPAIGALGATAALGAVFYNLGLTRLLIAIFDCATGGS